MTPWFALFWKMAGEDNPGWTCVGLYETKEEADENFHTWESVYDGLLIMTRVDQIASRSIAQVFREMRAEIAGDLVHMPAVLADLFGISRSEARRSLNQGGFREVDGDRIVDFDVPRERIDGVEVQYGRRRRARVSLAPREEDADVG